MCHDEFLKHYLSVAMETNENCTFLLELFASTTGVVIYINFRNPIWWNYCSRIYFYYCPIWWALV